MNRGYEPTFHNETGSYVEAPWEIEKVLELTEVGFCLDTGHIVVAGGDPVAAVHDWSERINHLHVKDARQSFSTASSRTTATPMRSGGGAPSVRSARATSRSTRCSRLFAAAATRAGSSSSRTSSRRRPTRTAGPLPSSDKSRLPPRSGHLTVPAIGLDVTALPGLRLPCLAPTRALQVAARTPQTCPHG